MSSCQQCPYHIYECLPGSRLFYLHSFLCSFSFDNCSYREGYFYSFLLIPGMKPFNELMLQQELVDKRLDPQNNTEVDGIRIELVISDKRLKIVHSTFICSHGFSGNLYSHPFYLLQVR